MNILSAQILPPLFTAIGDVFIGISVLKVHAKLGHEHKIDFAVISSIKSEKYLVIFGIIFIITGFFLQVIIY